LTENSSTVEGQSESSVHRTILTAVYTEPF